MLAEWLLYSGCGCRCATTINVFCVLIQIRVFTHLRESQYCYLVCFGVSHVDRHPRVYWLWRRLPLLVTIQMACYLGLSGMHVNPNVGAAQVGNLLVLKTVGPKRLALIMTMRRKFRSITHYCDYDRLNIRSYSKYV